MTTPSHKLRHIDACLTGPVEYQGVTTGFERLRLPYDALTQTSLTAVDLSTEFRGSPLAAPVLIGAMTGGAELARTINRNLAAHARRPARCPPNWRADWRTSPNPLREYQSLPVNTGPNRSR